jgi:hypothetical protein
LFRKVSEIAVDFKDFESITTNYEESMSKFIDHMNERLSY